jgi:hypothetical protein
MEAGAVSIAAPAAEGSRVVAERQPRKSLTPGSLIRTPIFGSPLRLAGAASRYFPTLFRRRERMQG